MGGALFLFYYCYSYFCYDLPPSFPFMKSWNSKKNKKTTKNYTIQRE